MSRTLSKKLANVEPGTLYVGVDLALKRNVAVVLSERARRLTRFGFPNNQDGYDYFHRRLETLRERHQAPAVLVGMEPTNYFWKLLAADMEQHRPDYGYRLVNPYTVKKNREGNQLDRSKDDNRDAFTIGTIVAFGTYLTQLYGPLMALTNAQVEFAQSMVSFERVFEVLDIPVEITESAGAVALSTVGGRIQFEKVSFAYESLGEGEKLGLDEIALKKGRKNWGKIEYILIIKKCSIKNPSTLLMSLPRYMPIKRLS